MRARSTHPSNQVSGHWQGRTSGRGTYEVEDLAGDDEVVETIHNLLDVSRVVPEVDVEEVDVVCAEALEALLNGEHERLDVVAGVVHLLLEGIITSTEVVRILRGTGLAQRAHPPRYGGRTLVARMSWSRIPRASAHSPMNASDVSS